MSLGAIRVVRAVDLPEHLALPGVVAEMVAGDSEPVSSAALTRETFRLSGSCFLL